MQYVKLISSFCLSWRLYEKTSPNKPGSQFTEDDQCKRELVAEEIILVEQIDMLLVNRNEKLKQAFLFHHYI